MKQSMYILFFFACYFSAQCMQERGNKKLKLLCPKPLNPGTADFNQYQQDMLSYLDYLQIEDKRKKIFGIYRTQKNH